MTRKLAMLAATIALLAGCGSPSEGSGEPAPSSTPTVGEYANQYEESLDMWKLQECVDMLVLLGEEELNAILYCQS